MKIIKHEGQGGRHPLTLRDAMSRFFEEPFWDPFGHLAEWPSLNRVGTVMHRYLPSIDVSETEKEMKIVANIPGYDPKNITVELERGNLVIRGKSEEEKEDKDRHYFTRERACGEFYREIALPPYADGEKAECKYKNGTLTIVIPREKDKEKKHLRIEME